MLRSRRRSLSHLCGEMHACPAGRRRRLNDALAAVLSPVSTAAFVSNYQSLCGICFCLCIAILNLLSRMWRNNRKFSFAVRRNITISNAFASSFVVLSVLAKHVRTGYPPGAASHSLALPRLLMFGAQTCAWWSAHSRLTSVWRENGRGSVEHKRPHKRKTNNDKKSLLTGWASRVNISCPTAHKPYPTAF